MKITIMKLNIHSVLNVKMIIVLLILTNAFDISANILEFSNNYENYTNNSSTDNDSYPYGNAYYNFFDVSLSSNQEYELSLNTEIMGINVSAVTKRLLVGLSFVQLSINSSELNLSVIELNSRLNIFDIVSNDNNLQLYDFLHLKLRPISATFVYNDTAKYEPLAIIGYELIFRHEMLSIFASANYVCNFMNLNNNSLVITTGLRMALYGPFIPR